MLSEPVHQQLPPSPRHGAASQVLPPSRCFGAINRDAGLQLHFGRVASQFLGNKVASRCERHSSRCALPPNQGIIGKSRKVIYKINPGLWDLLSKNNENEERGIIAGTERHLPQRGAEDAKKNKPVNFIMCFL
jgi:hypothetical protein